LTAQGSPRTRFRRAIEGRWVFHAELAAREAGNLTLTEALELVCLYAEAEPAKFEKAALRWHARFVTESAPSLLRAQIALAALAELRAGSEPAKNVLLGLVGQPPNSTAAHSAQNTGSPSSTSR
jgi:hypothetical protein